MAGGKGLSSDVQALLDAVTAIGSDLDLPSVLDRIVASACTLTGAQYGALGVIGPSGGTLTEFITHGLDQESRDAIGELPHGRGILGLLIRKPDPLRLPLLQEHEASFGFPANHPPMTTFLGVPVRVRDTVFGNLYLTDKAGGIQFTEEDERLVEALAKAAGFVIDNARAYAVSERQRAWLEAASRLGDALQPGSTIQEVLQQVAVSTRAVSGARAVGVLYSEDGEPLELAAMDGRAAEELAPLVESLRSQIEAAGAGASSEPVPSSDQPSTLVLPLRTHLRGSAVMLVLLDDEQRHTAMRALELELVTSFADQSGLALDRVQAVLDREELALVSDRDRIARDLHDLVIQRLFATGIHLQGIRSQVGSAVVLERLDGAVADLDATIRDIRTSIFELQQPERQTLRATLRGLVEEYSPVLGFAPVIRTIGPVDTVVPDDVAQHLLAVVREGLSNVARHAEATYAVVEIQGDQQWLVLRISDDGVGPGEPGQESGLRNARERASKLRGAMQISSRVPSGTLLEWRVPLASL